MSEGIKDKSSIADDILNTDAKAKSLPRFDVDNNGNLLVDGKPTKTTLQLEKNTYRLLLIGTVSAVVSAVAAVVTAVIGIPSAIATWKQAEIAEKAFSQNKINNEDDHNKQINQSGNVNVPATPLANPVNDNLNIKASLANTTSQKKKCKNR